MSSTILTPVPRFDGVHRLPWVVVPKAFARAEWIIRLGTLIERAEELKASQLREWRAVMEVIEERRVGSKKSDGKVDDVCEGTLWD